MRLIDADALIGDIDGDLTDSVAERKAIEKINNAPTISTINGYSINELVTFAMACRENGVSTYNMREFCLDVSNAYDFAVTEANKKLQAALRSELEKYRKKADAEKEKG